MKRIAIVVIASLFLNLLPARENSVCSFMEDCSMKMEFSGRITNCSGNSTEDNSPVGLPGKRLPQAVRTLFFSPIQHISVNRDFSYTLYKDNIRWIPPYFPSESIQFLS